MTLKLTLQQRTVVESALIRTYQAIEGAAEKWQSKDYFLQYEVPEYYTCIEVLSTVSGFSLHLLKPRVWGA